MPFRKGNWCIFLLFCKVFFNVMELNTIEKSSLTYLNYVLSWFRYFDTFHSHLLLLIITLSHPTRDAATTRVENDYFGFSFSKQKNELHLFVAKFALVLDKCLV